MVATEAGLRPIETVREGERVWAKDLRDGQWKLRHVLQTFERMNDGVLLSLKVAREEIRVTPGHPFWVVEGQDLQSRPWPAHVGAPLAVSQLPGRWVDAGELRVGDVLYLKSGALEAIEQIERHEVWEKVYNFQVEELECYAVGACEVLVHNASKKCVIGENMKDVQTVARKLGAKWYQAWSKNFVMKLTPTKLKAALERNKRWITSKIREKYKIFDIGVDPSRKTRSPFYEQEKQIISNHGYPVTPVPRP
jgi:hypothetical protein